MLTPDGAYAAYDFFAFGFAGFKDFDVAQEVEVTVAAGEKFEGVLVGEGVGAEHAKKMEGSAVCVGGETGGGCRGGHWFWW